MKRGQFKKTTIENNEVILKIAKDLGITPSEVDSIIIKMLNENSLAYYKDELEAIFCKAYNLTPKEYEKQFLFLPITEYREKLKAILKVHNDLKDIIPERLIPEMRKDNIEIEKPKMTDENNSKIKYKKMQWSGTKKQFNFLFDELSRNSLLLSVESKKWLGTQRQLVYLFEQLSKYNLIPKNFLSVDHKGFIKIAEIFLSKENNPLKNTNLTNVYSQLSYITSEKGKKKLTDVLEIVKRTKNLT